MPRMPQAEYDARLREAGVRPAIEGGIVDVPRKPGATCVLCRGNGYGHISSGRIRCPRCNGSGKE